MKRPGEILFTLICVGFSAFLLVSSLMMSIDETRISQELVETHRQTEEEKLRRERLVLETEETFSLSEIDSYAREKLKMQTPRAGQIIYLGNR